MSRQRLWIIVSIIVTAAVLLMGWFLLVLPMLSAAGEADAERAKVASQNQEHEARIVKLKAQYADIDTLRASLADMQSSLPPDAAADALITEIDAKAAAGGVTITSVTVSQPIPFVPRGGLTTNLVDATNFLSMQVTIGVSGSNDAVMAFTSSLREGPRLFVPDSVTFSSPTAITGPEMSATLSGQSYILIDAAHPVGSPVPICGSEEAAAAQEASTSPIRCLQPF